MIRKNHAVVDAKPDGFEWQRCTHTGCRRKANAVVHPHHYQANHDTHFCHDHAIEMVEDDKGVILQSVAPGRGRGIARKRQRAYGGWTSWQRVMVGEPPQDCECGRGPVAVIGTRFAPVCRRCRAEQDDADADRLRNLDRAFSRSNERPRV
jgi:hypothetical protein